LLGVLHSLYGNQYRNKPIWILSMPKNQIGVKFE
jgi:hypothetical protein